MICVHAHTYSRTHAGTHDQIVLHDFIGPHKLPKY